MKHVNQFHLSAISYKKSVDSNFLHILHTPLFSFQEKEIENSDKIKQGSFPTVHYAFIPLIPLWFSPSSFLLTTRLGITSDVSSLQLAHISKILLLSI